MRIGRIDEDVTPVPTYSILYKVHLVIVHSFRITHQPVHRVVAVVAVSDSAPFLSKWRVVVSLLVSIVQVCIAAPI
jgi:hypothetical protein